MHPLLAQESSLSSKGSSLRSHCNSSSQIVRTIQPYFLSSHANNKRRGRGGTHNVKPKYVTPMQKAERTTGRPSSTEKPQPSRPAKVNPALGSIRTRSIVPIYRTPSVFVTVNSRRDGRRREARRLAEFRFEPPFIPSCHYSRREIRQRSSQ